MARLHGGAVDNYLGDCLMAVFGHPVPLPDPARAALAAALEMRRRVQDYDARAAVRHAARGRDRHQHRPHGRGRRARPVVREFHVLGDAVNVAARLKARAALGKILVGGETRAAAADGFEFASLGSLPLKGKREPSRSSS